MDIKNKRILIAAIVAGVIIITFGALACTGLFRGFDAQSYVKAMLDQTLKGDVENTLNMVEGVTEAQLQAQYEAGVSSFTKNNILNKVEVDKELEAKYVAHCKDIFAGMKYKVGEAEEVGEDEYRVPVKYQASDVYLKFIASVQEERQNRLEQVEKGAYQGETLEEVIAQMEAEVLNNSCDLLGEACKTMEFGKEETMNFTVKKGENGLYQLEEGEIAEFLIKIMSLDAIQD